MSSVAVFEAAIVMKSVYIIDKKWLKTRQREHEHDLRHGTRDGDCAELLCNRRCITLCCRWLLVNGRNCYLTCRFRLNLFRCSCKTRFDCISRASLFGVLEALLLFLYWFWKRIVAHECSFLCFLRLFAVLLCFYYYYLFIYLYCVPPARSW